MRILDLFAGLGGWSEAARDRGHDVRTLDLDPRFGADYVLDIRDATPATFGHWRPDLVLASPPCERFTVMQIGRHWHRAKRGGIVAPRSPEALEAVEIVTATLALIQHLAPDWWVLENPRAMLGALPLMAGNERRTVTYCQLGLEFMKPTHLWGGFPASLELPAPCKRYATCHRAAPRGSKTGIQDGAMSPAERAKVPYRLGELVVLAAERDAVLPNPRPVGALPVIGDLYQLGLGWLAPAEYVHERPRSPLGRFMRA